MRLRRCYTSVAVLSLAVLLVPLLLSSCRTAEQDASRTSAASQAAFAIVLADAGEVLLTGNDVAAYYSDNHTLALNTGGIEKWNSHLTYGGIPKLAESLFQREFIIEAEGKEICRGKFWSGVSSASVNGVVILDSLFRLDLDRNAIWIESGYPAGGALDPTVNAALERVLQKR